MTARFECPFASEEDCPEAFGIVDGTGLATPSCSVHDCAMLLVSVETDAGTDPRELESPTRALPDGKVDYLRLENAVLLDYSEFSRLDARQGEEVTRAIAVRLSGRINKSDDRADLLFLTNVDGLAALMTEALNLAHRVPGYREAVIERLRELGAFAPHPGRAETRRLLGQSSA